MQHFMYLLQTINEKNGVDCYIINDIHINTQCVIENDP